MHFFGLEDEEPKTLRDCLVRVPLHTGLSHAVLYGTKSSYNLAKHFFRHEQGAAGRKKQKLQVCLW